MTDKHLTLGEGLISARELREVMAGLGECLSEEEIEDIMKEVDTDGDGLVNYQGMYCANLVPRASSLSTLSREKKPWERGWYCAKVSRIYTYIKSA